MQVTDWASALCSEFGQDAAAVLAQVDELRPHLPDPARADDDLQAFLAADGQTASSLRQFRGDPWALELLLRLGGVSRYGFDVARQFPGVFWEIVQERQFRQVWGRQLLSDHLGTALAAIDDPVAKGNRLAQVKHHHWLRVLLGELAGELDLPVAVAELSDIVDALADGAIQLAISKLTARFGTPLPAEHPHFPGFCILGMGKLGGRELNYSSDIDLIFVYEVDESLAWDADIDRHEWFKRLGTEVIRLLEEPGDHGRLLRVDMRLRPEGDRGELVLSRRELVEYYYAVGRPWERQACLKMRPIAGARAIGLTVVRELEPWIFPLDPNFDDLAESRSMRRRIEERAADRNVKTGAGGIRDIEFLVQYFQLAYGGRQHDLRRRDTLPTLHLLADHRLLPRAECRRLAGHYRFLRMVEHRLQLWEDRQEHDIPGDPRERAAVAQRCGFRGDDALARFDQRLDHVRNEVRAIVARHFLDDSKDADALLALLVQGELDPAKAASVLAGHRFRDPLMVATKLRAMAVEPFFVLSRHRTERALAKLLPVLLHLVAHTPEPDATIANLERITAAVGGRATFFELLGGNPQVLRWFTDFAGWSEFLVERFHDFPGLPDDVVDVLNQGARRPIHLHVEARDLIRGIADPLPPLAHFVAREQCVAAIQDLDGRPPTQVSAHLTATAEAVIRALLHRLVSERSRAWGLPHGGDGRPVRFAILALGKLGGSELSFASDMDVLLVCDPGGTCPKVDKDGGEFWLRITQDLLRGMDEGRLYELDPRLRPWGDQGELVPNTEALRHYWSSPRELWERLAMVRARTLAGDERLGQETVALLRQRAIAAPLPDDAATQVRSMRQRLEHSVDGKDHVKRGFGGYVDVEFIAQFLLLGLPVETLPTDLGTTKSLTFLRDQGRIDATAHDELVDALAFLRHVESRMRLWQGKAISSLPIDPEPRLALARRCGVTSVAALDEQLHHHRTQARHWFDALVR